MSGNLPPVQDSPESRSDIILYRTEDGQSRIQVRMDGQTVWLTQRLMADLFQTTPQNITIHLKSVYDEGELAEAATCKEYLQVRQEGARQVRRSLKYYNLDAILAVGYLVRSPRGTAFRQSATERLREYLVKGFTLDDERLNGRDRAASRRRRQGQHRGAALRHPLAGTSRRLVTIQIDDSSWDRPENGNFV